MEDNEKRLWDTIDRAIFKTNDSEKILERVKSSGASWLEDRSTFGGSLKQIRKSRRLTTNDCAKRMGISKSLWQSWEANRQVPTSREFGEMCSAMNFGERKKKRFLGLLEGFPKQRLLVFSRFRPESLAARGVARIERELEVQKLPGKIQEKLISWCKQQGISSFESLGQHLLELQEEKQRELWVEEVLRTDD